MYLLRTKINSLKKEPFEILPHLNQDQIFKYSKIVRQWEKIDRVLGLNRETRNRLKDTREFGLWER